VETRAHRLDVVGESLARFVEGHTESFSDVWANLGTEANVEASARKSCQIPHTVYAVSIGLRVNASATAVRT
jgi:hypothetical protein